MILLDGDGCIADFVNASLDYLRRAWGMNFTEDDVGEWDVCEALKLPTHVREAMRRHWKTLGFCTAIEPYPGAKDFVRNLRELGPFKIVTAPMNGSRTWAWEREQWLWHHFEISRDDVVSVRDKAVVAGHVMIDDSAANILTTTARHRILFDRPWNRRDVSLSAYRTGNYQQILSILKDISMNDGRTF